LEVILLKNDSGSVLEYAVTTGPLCGSEPWWASLWFILIGAVCGIFGAIFNWLNIKVMRYRARYCNAGMPCRRALELIVLCVFTSTAWLGATALFGERPATSSEIFPSSTGCVSSSWMNQVISGSVIVSTEQSNYDSRYLPRPCLFGVQRNSSLCPQAFDRAKSNAFARACSEDLIRHSIIVGRPDATSYCCSFDSVDELLQGHFQLPSNASCSLELGESLPSLGSGAVEEVTSYNPMAALALVPFKESLQNLFVRGAPRLIPFSVLVVFFILFFVASSVTAGSAVPSGLLMPQMIVGALIGRMMTLPLGFLERESGSALTSHSGLWSPAYLPIFGLLPPEAPLTPGATSFLDPGVGALVGAAAFLGGSGRITLFTTVMMVEITGDPAMIFPVGLATIVAVIVGDYLNHGLYHALLDVQSLPYLPDTWDADHLPFDLRVEDMMPRNKVITIPGEGFRDDVEAAVVECAKHGFDGMPVVNRAGAVIGMAQRSRLELLLKDEGTMVFALQSRETKQYVVANEDNLLDMNGEEATTAARFELIGEDNLTLSLKSCNFGGCISAVGDRLLTEGDEGAQLRRTDDCDEAGAPLIRLGKEVFRLVSLVDVGSVTDFYPLTVRPGYPLQMAYQLFKSMEMNHLVVVDEHHRPKAVMTRFAFLVWRVSERLGAERILEMKAREHLHRTSVLSRRGQRQEDARRLPGASNLSLQPFHTTSRPRSMTSPVP